VRAKHAVHEAVFERTLLKFSKSDVYTYRARDTEALGAGLRAFFDDAQVSSDLRRVTEKIHAFSALGTSGPVSTGVIPYPPRVAGVFK